MVITLAIGIFGLISSSIIWGIILRRWLLSRRIKPGDFVVVKSDKNHPYGYRSVFFVTEVSDRFVFCYPYTFARVEIEKVCLIGPKNG